MIEAVGAQFMDTFLPDLQRSAETRRSGALIQAITIADRNYNRLT